MGKRKSTNDIRKQLKQLKDDLQEVVDDIPKIKRDVANEISLQWYEDLDEIFTISIDKFYADYEPKFYRRTGSLYSVYKLTRHNGIINWDFGAQYMPDTHRVDNQYIYDWVFLQGYHGGANTIAESKVDKWGEHPHEGQPWYRTPHPSLGVTPYTAWSKYYAKKTMPPALRIETQLKKYQEGKSDLIGRGMNDAITPAWELVLGRYKLFNY